jgi:hypothetical protein
MIQLTDLLPAQFRKVAGAYFNTLNAVQLAVLKAPQIHEINTAQIPISCLFAEQRNMLTEAQVKAIVKAIGDSSQLESLPKSGFKYLSLSQVSWLTKAQIDSLTRNDIIEIVKANPDLLMAFINTGKMRGEQSYWGKAVLFTKEAREITGFYYDHEKGKMLPQYEGLTPEEVPACVADGLCWRTNPKKNENK